MRNITDYGLPLLARELLILANRKRTYALRTLYPLVLLVVVGIVAANYILDSSETVEFALLGNGRVLFETINVMLFIGIYLFVPSMTATAIAQEKQRETLDLLLLTKLGRWTILFEKLLSGLIPALSLLLTAVPLMAAAYPLGGISEDYLIKAVWVMLLAILQASVAGLFCSTLVKNVSTALVSTYILLFVWMFGQTLAVQMVGLTTDSAHYYFTPIVMYSLEFGRSVPDFFQYTIPLVVSCVLLFCLSRWTLIRFAFCSVRDLSPSLHWPEFLKKKRRVHAEAVNSAPVAAMATGASRNLPDDEPIRWQLRYKTVAGNPKAIAGILVAVELVLLIPAATCLLSLTSAPHVSFTLMSILYFFLWIITALVLPIRGVGLLSGDRSRQTLNVLLATPMKTKDIVLQRVQGQWPFVMAFAVPLASCMCWTVLLRGQNWSSRRYGYDPDWYFAVIYVPGTLLLISVYAWFLLWLGTWLGLRMRNQTRASVTVLGVLVAWMVFWPACGVVPHALFNMFRDPPGFMLISPLLAIPIFEFCEFDEFSRNTSWLNPAFFILLAIGIHAGLAYWFRRDCIRNAARLLNRGERIESVD